MADRRTEIVGTVAFVLILAGVGWWVWSENNDGDGTASEAAASQATATTTLPRIRTTTTTALEWPPWCGRYVALRVANEAYDAAYDAYASAYDSEHEAARSAYDEADAALSEAEAASDAAFRDAEVATEKELESGEFGAFDAEELRSIARQTLDDVRRAHDAKAAAGEALEAFTSKAEAEDFAMVEAARAYVVAGRVYADGYSDEYAAAVLAVRNHDVASVALDEAQAASDNVEVAYAEAQAAYDEAQAAYDAGAEDAMNGSAFFPLGHREDAYRAGWQAYQEAHASGDPFGYIGYEPPVVARLSAAEDAARDRLYELIGSEAAALDG
ncbi:MAG: hypothetical protein OXH86_18665 [Acidimicrobiaceae bacterium]|nr:hypothetical protein [Acidimicrobiaceae bacterium]MDE0318511.1 hypothetical protein [Acidimicrobiaceae bacterium]MDE0499366.1 hypothetical protein [Acidimicrobiaceae bacterium]